MSEKTRESKKVIRARAKNPKASTKQALGRTKRTDSAKDTTYHCKDCKSHSTNPSYCKNHKKDVGKNQNQCEDFS